VIWEWQCDHEDEATTQLPPMQESQRQIRTPYEGDKLAEFWAASMQEEAQEGPLAFVEAIWFQSIVGCVIACNAIIIGLETDVQSPYWSRIENSLLVFFVMELLLRVCHHGCDKFIISFGNLFDVLIVCAGVFDTWLVPIVDFVMGVEQTTRSAFMSVIQMLRLLRIIRLIRLVKIVQPLYRLALGIAEAIQGMFWVLVFLAMMLYAMAILLTRLIGHDDSLFADLEAEAAYQGPRVHAGRLGRARGSGPDHVLVGLLEHVCPLRVDVLLELDALHAFVRAHAHAEARRGDVLHLLRVGVACGDDGCGLREDARGKGEDELRGAGPS